MIEYLGNYNDIHNAIRITLNSGNEIIISVNELEELGNLINRIKESEEKLENEMLFI